MTWWFDHPFAAALITVAVGYGVAAVALCWPTGGRR